MGLMQKEGLGPLDGLAIFFFLFPVFMRYEAYLIDFLCVPAPLLGTKWQIKLDLLSGTNHLRFRRGRTKRSLFKFNSPTSCSVLG